MKTIDTDQLKSQTNLIEIAQTDTTLAKESTNEYSGPCPKCGGNDRFHVTPEWFFCRQCHEKRGDAIDYIQWRDNTNFQSACEYLANGNLPTIDNPNQPRPQPIVPTKTQPEDWHIYANRILTAAQNRLIHSDNAQPARDYLLARGITEDAWLIFRLGLHDASLPGTQGKQRAPAIALPWYSGPKLKAIRYRFLEPHTYTDQNERQRKAVQKTSQYDSDFRSILYGGPALQHCAIDKKTFVLVEGEINAMSIWQVGRYLNIETLSYGSESQHLCPAAINYINKYRQIIIWCDRPEQTRRLLNDFPNAHPISSPQQPTTNDQQLANQLDANDIHKHGGLTEFLARTLINAARAEEHKQAIRWDIHDALAGGLNDPGLQNFYNQTWR